jgi:hypothetical protein
MAPDNETFTAIKLWLGAMACAATGAIFHWHGTEKQSVRKPPSFTAKMVGLFWAIGASCFVAAMVIIPSGLLTAIVNTIAIKFNVAYTVTPFEVALPVAAFFGHIAQALLRSTRRVFINFVERSLPGKDKTPPTDHTPL